MNIQPQRQAILQAISLSESICFPGPKSFWLQGYGEIFPYGVSKGSNSLEPWVLVFGEEEPDHEIDISEDLAKCSYGVLLERHEGVNRAIAPPAKEWSLSIRPLHIVELSKAHVLYERGGEKFPYPNLI